ncbi:MAG: hypothetical protein QXX12_02940 [Nanopusillaceae archaeon]
MISLKEAIEIYNNNKDTNFWNFLARKALQIEENNGLIPNFVKETLSKRVPKIKAKAILKPSQGALDKKLISGVKSLLKTKGIKYSTICLIKYISQMYYEELEELKNRSKSLVLRTKNFSIKIQKVLDPSFDFYDREPLYEIKFNAKTKSIFIKALGSCEKYKNKSSWYERSQINARLRIIDCDTLLILIFIYDIERIGENFRQRFSHSSYYTVAKALYILKEPFHIIKSSKRFIYISRSNFSPDDLDIKELPKKFEPQHEKDKPVFKRLSSFLKKNQLSFSERIERI